jgi:peptide chain release factor
MANHRINKTNSAAQLTHIPTGIVVKSQATRSRSQNYTIARKLLAEKVELLEKGDESRAAKVLARKAKKKASADKKKRRKYRELAAEKAGGIVDSEDGEENLEDEQDEESENTPTLNGDGAGNQRGEDLKVHEGT